MWRVCHNADMDRVEVLRKLRAQEETLRAAGIEHLRLYGSTARGEAGADSDVDLLADFDPARRWTLITIGRLQSDLSEMLGANVDLAAPTWLRRRIAPGVLKEAVLVF